MQTPIRFITIGAIAALACACGSGLALAAQQTTLTMFQGVVSGPNGPNGVAAAGTHTRTITDVGQPNGPQSVYLVQVNWTSGMTAAQYAAAYQAACNATLPAASTGANGYGTARENRVVPMIRLSKQSGTYDYSDAGIPPGITVTTFVPGTAEDAPATTPAGLASLAASLSALAWWVRRRKSSA